LPPAPALLSMPIICVFAVKNFLHAAVDSRTAGPADRVFRSVSDPCAFRASALCVIASQRFRFFDQDPPEARRATRRPRAPFLLVLGFYTIWRVGVRRLAVFLFLQLKMRPQRKSYAWCNCSPSIHQAQTHRFGLLLYFEQERIGERYRSVFHSRGYPSCPILFFVYTFSLPFIATSGVISSSSLLFFSLSRIATLKE